MMMEDKQNIYLCGFMATGKSAVGRRLAVLLGCDFLDLDDLIAAEAGMTISQIFAAQGEPRFRELETQMVECLASRSSCVIATGGGTMVNQRNLEALKRNGIVITLTADPQVILSRIGSGEDRPMLWEGDKLERIQALLAQRGPFYAKADITVDNSFKNVDQVVKNILDIMSLRNIHPLCSVVTGTDNLADLDEREFRSRLAEIVKLAMIRDRSFFKYLENNAEKVGERDTQVLRSLVGRAYEIKASLMKSDGRGSENLLLLNFGHIVENVFESAPQQLALNRGEALALGMIVVTILSLQKHMCSEEDLKRLKLLLQTFGFPTRLPVPPQKFTRLMPTAEKVQGGLIRLVLLRGIGDAVESSLVKLDELKKALIACG